MGLIALVTWTALVLQFYLILQSRSATGFSTARTVINFFSYFTILSNLLIAVCLTAALLTPASAAGKFFSNISVQSAIAVYIFIVGLVYNTVLRGIASLSGLAWVVDNLLHVVVPLFFVIFWLVYTPRKALKWKDILPWLIFPALYLAYSLLRGPVANWYPYPFLHAAKLGYGQVAINALCVLAGFLAAGAAIIGFNRRGGAER